jgi:hypothetical protein
MPRGERKGVFTRGEPARQWYLLAELPPAELIAALERASQIRAECSPSLAGDLDQVRRRLAAAVALAQCPARCTSFQDLSPRPFFLLVLQVRPPARSMPPGPEIEGQTGSDLHTR